MPPGAAARARRGAAGALESAAGVFGETPTIPATAETLGAFSTAETLGERLTGALSVEPAIRHTRIRAATRQQTTRPLGPAALPSETSLRNVSRVSALNPAETSYLKLRARTANIAAHTRARLPLHPRADWPLLVEDGLNRKSGKLQQARG